MNQTISQAGLFPKGMVIVEKISGEKKVHFYLTGFGQFQGVPSNPTTTLMQELPAYLAKHPVEGVQIESFTVVETSGVAATEYFKKLDQSPQEQRAIFVHFGVNGSATKFALEQTGWNNADFRVCDERQWQPCCQPIHASITDISHSLKTSLPLTSLQKQLSNSFKVEISDDPGRFVCNFIYYSSLLYSGANKTQSLFVHVPQFSVSNQEEQLAFARTLLSSIATETRNMSL